MMIKITTDFRHEQVPYPASDTPVDVPDDVATLATKEGWAVIIGGKSKAKKTQEVTASEAA